MSEANSKDDSSASTRPVDSNDAAERKEQPTPATAAAASSSLVPSVEDAPRRSQLRGEAGRDAPENERGRLEPHATEPVARDALRASALAAPSAEWRSFGPAQRLFTDGIASCLRFLALAEFNSAAQTCKQWRVGAHAVQSLGAQTLDAGAVGRRLISIPSSPFGKLITSLTLSSGSSNRAPLDLRALVNLRSITLILTPAIFESATVVFPPQLETAQLNFGRCSQPPLHSEDAIITMDASFLMRGLQSCASLTRLELLSCGIDLDLTAVAGLQQLRELSIEAWTHLSDGLMRAIKTLPLRSLTLRSLRSDSGDLTMQWDRALELLLTLPHALQRSLQTFRLTFAERADETEVPQTLSLHPLIHCAPLHTVELCNVRLSAADRAALTPPSTALPLLTTFALSLSPPRPRAIDHALMRMSRYLQGAQHMHAAQLMQMHAQTHTATALPFTSAHAAATLLSLSLQRPAQPDR